MFIHILHDVKVLALVIKIVKLQASLRECKVKYGGHSLDIVRA